MTETRTYYGVERPAEFEYTIITDDRMTRQEATEMAERLGEGFTAVQRTVTLPNWSFVGSELPPMDYSAYDMPAEEYNALMPILLSHPSREAVFIAEKMRARYGASARKRADRERAATLARKSTTDPQLDHKELGQ